MSNYSNYSNKSKYSNNYYYINNSNKSNNNDSNCNTIWRKNTEIGSLLHRMHNVKWLVFYDWRHHGDCRRLSRIWIFVAMSLLWAIN